MRSFLVVAALAFSARGQEFAAAPEDGASGLEHAIAAASAAGGGEVVLASGVYRLDRTLAFKADGVTVRSAEKGGAGQGRGHAAQRSVPAASSAHFQENVIAENVFCRVEV